MTQADLDTIRLAVAAFVLGVLVGQWDERRVAARPVAPSQATIDTLAMDCLAPSPYASCERYRQAQGRR